MNIGKKTGHRAGMFGADLKETGCCFAYAEKSKRAIHYWLFNKTPGHWVQAKFLTLGKVCSTLTTLT